MAKATKGLQGVAFQVVRPTQVKVQYPQARVPAIRTPAPSRAGNPIGRQVARDNNRQIAAQLAMKPPTKAK